MGHFTRMGKLYMQTNFNQHGEKIPLGRHLYKRNDNELSKLIKKIMAELSESE